MGMSMKRFARLINAHSKKLTNHRHALALHFTFYNWIHIHKTLRITLAMAAGLTHTPMEWGESPSSTCFTRPGRRERQTGTVPNLRAS